MKLKFVFIIVAVFLFVTGMLAVVVPARLIAEFSVDPTPATIHFTRNSGVGSIAVAVMAFLARNAGPSTARDALVGGIVLLLALHAISDAVSILGGIIGPQGWLGVGVSAVLSALVAITGRPTS